MPEAPISEIMQTYAITSPRQRGFGAQAQQLHPRYFASPSAIWIGARGYEDCPGGTFAGCAVQISQVLALLSDRQSLFASAMQTPVERW